MIMPAVSRAPWMERGACVGRPVNQFVVDGYTPNVHDRAKIRAAKAICADCPVQRECLKYGYDTNDTKGILGGLTPDERKRRKEGTR